MPFDPDKYLRESNSGGGFDPDSYLSGSSSVIETKPNWAKEYPRLYDIAKKTRDVSGPTIEMLGSIGGGLIGTASGAIASPTVVINPITGAVAGSALGYGIAKSALDAADELLGTKKPAMTASEAVTRGANNLATGAMYEMGGQIGGNLLQKGLQLTGKAISKGVGNIADLGQIPEQKAAELARAAAGSKLQQIKNALREAPDGVTAAQAIASKIDPVTKTAVINSPETQSLLRMGEEASPAFFSDVRRSQDAAIRNMLSDIAGGSSQSESIAYRAAEKNALNKLTTPMREAELSAANTAGKKLAELGEKSVNKQEAMVKALQNQWKMETEAAKIAKNLGDSSKNNGFSEAADVFRRVKGQNQIEKDFIDYQLKSLEAHGLRPLESAPIVNNIRQVLNDPSYAGNDIARGAADNIAEEISKWTNRGGVIDATALDAIRKNAVNATIAKLRPGMDQAAQKEAAAGVLSKIKPVIDDAIESAGGTGWRNYLETYSAGMNELNKTKLGAEAMRLYTSSPQKFLDLVENNSPKTLQKIFGPDNYDLARAMGDEVAIRLKNAGNQIRTAKDIEIQSKEGQKALESLMKDRFFKFQLPDNQHAPTTLINKLLDMVTGKIGEKTMKVVADSAKSAKSFDDLLNTLPSSERNKILRVLNDPEVIKKYNDLILPNKYMGGVTAGINSAADVNNNVNSLTP